MYYCFVQEDLVNLGDEDSLVIQAKYAKRLGLYCCCRLSERIIVDQDNQSIDIKCKYILLRATCNTMQQAAAILEDNGADLLEKFDDICAIEHWDSLNLAKRKIFTVSFRDIFENTFSDQINAFLLETPQVFVKSREKGFCVQFPSQRLFQRETELLNFFKVRCTHISNELLLSEKLGVKADSLGLKESRHFVFGGVISSSSRTLHSIKHAVPQTLLAKAAHLVDAISLQTQFPQNYVLDVGEFERKGEIFCDIVEINPVTSSLCYVNNSVFDKRVPEAAGLQKKMGMGIEYCYDAIAHPDRYMQKRYSQACYEYTSTEHYIFL